LALKPPKVVDIVPAEMCWGVLYIHGRSRRYRLG
jgi:hypothetical protein